MPQSPEVPESGGTSNSCGALLVPSLVVFGVGGRGASLHCFEARPHLRPVVGGLEAKGLLAKLCWGLASAAPQSSEHKLAHYTLGFYVWSWV